MRTTFMMTARHTTKTITKVSEGSLLLILSLLLLSGCTTASAPPSPTSPPATAAEIPAAPTNLATAIILPTVTALAAPIVSEKDRREMTEQLLLAAEAGDTAAVKQYMQEGADINGRDQLGRTPAMAATHGIHAETVAALIQAGADIDLRDNRLDNPFLYAGAEALMEILRLAIDAGADTTLTNRFGGTALIPAAERGHVAIVERVADAHRCGHRSRERPGLDRVAGSDCAQRWRRSTSADRAVARGPRSRHQHRRPRGASRRWPTPRRVASVRSKRILNCGAMNGIERLISAARTGDSSKSSSSCWPRAPASTHR